LVKQAQNDIFKFLDWNIGMMEGWKIESSDSQTFPVFHYSNFPFLKKKIKSNVCDLSEQKHLNY